MFWKIRLKRRPLQAWLGQSLAQRLLLLAALWIVPLLAIGGIALDRVVTRTFAANLDARLAQYLTSLIAAAEVGPVGEVRLSRPIGDQGFFEAYSGLYYQISAPNQADFRSRSLWDRVIRTNLSVRHDHTSLTTRTLWSAHETLRVIEQDVALPGAQRPMRFIVAASTNNLAQQIADFRVTLLRALTGLGIGLIILSGVQATYGLWPLRRIQRGLEAIRSGRARRLETDYPQEVQPLVAEMNSLLDHSDAAAEEARTHAGNLAHALKTPMAVLINEANTRLDRATILTQVETMQSHVEHHLARARMLGRRAMISARTPIWPSLERLIRVLERLYQNHKNRGVTITLSGDKTLSFRGDVQDFEEIIGNILDNACKYGEGVVDVFVDRAHEGELRMVRIAIEDNGPGIPPGLRSHLFKRGARLDESQTGTGLGLAIVRDVVANYGGSVSLGESPQLHGLKLVLNLPAAE